MNKRNRNNVKDSLVHSWGSVSKRS